LAIAGDDRRSGYFANHSSLKQRQTFTISAPMGVVDVSLNNNQPNGIVRVGVANLNSVSLSGLMNVYLQD
jgi:hypothetical protein